MIDLIVSWIPAYARDLSRLVLSLFGAMWAMPALATFGLAFIDRSLTRSEQRIMFVGSLGLAGLCAASFLPLPSALPVLIAALAILVITYRVDVKSHESSSPVQ